MSLVGLNGKKLSTSGPTGRKVILHEVLEQGVPGLKIEAVGQWFKSQTPAEFLRGRLLMINYLLKAAISLDANMLASFLEGDVKEEVQNELQKGEEKE